jgi:hypothetical protein
MAARALWPLICPQINRSIRPKDPMVPEFPTVYVLCNMHNALGLVAQPDGLGQFI